MKKNNTTWIKDLENLTSEVLVSEKVYGTLVQSDRYPEKRPYFKQRHFTQQQFGHVLRREYHILSGRKASVSRTEYIPIFNLLEKKLLEDPMTKKEVDLLILEKEQQLIDLYQGILANIDLPDATNAILQSQAEDLNDMLKKLLLDYRISRKD